MSGKRLFLESCLINLLATTIAVATLVSAQSQTQGLSDIARMLVGVIGVIYVYATIYALHLCWKIDASKYPASHTSVAHKSRTIAFVANECPYVGMLGSVAGILIFMNSAMSSTENLEHLRESAMMGIGVSFVPTIVGIFARIILFWQHHLILQAIEEPAVIPVNT